MSDLGIFSSKLSINSKSLKEFDDSLRYLRGKSTITHDAQTTPVINKLLVVISPISEILKNEFSKSMAISEFDVVNTLKEWHNTEWTAYKTNILGLVDKLNSPRITLSKNDFLLLDDIADALDAECQKLFRRMGER